MSRSHRRYRTERRPLMRREPQIEVMEQRMLMSVTGAIEGIGCLIAEDPKFAPAILHAPLGERETNGGPENAPVFAGFPPVILGEDDNDFYLDLTTAFQNVGGGSAGLQFQVRGTTNAQLFDSVSIQAQRLRLDLARNTFGNASIRIRATSATNQYVEAILPVTILPVNDRPTTTGLSNLILEPNQTRVEIDLFGSFSDVEDAPHELTYTLTENTRPDLFETITIDPIRGLLLIHVRPGVQGTGTLTIRATDQEGAYVEMTTRGQDFKVYDAIEGEWPQVDALQLDSMNIVTNWWLFEQVNGQYVFDHLYESQLRNYLNSPFFDPMRPTVFNIENDFYENTPAGRELRAQVMRIFRDESPGAMDAGFYAYLPRREWHPAVDWRRALDDIERELFTWYSWNVDEIQQARTNWHEYNSRWRTSPLLDGTYLTDYITAVYPSMYAFYRYGHSTYAGAEIIDVEYSGSTGKFNSTSMLIVNDLSVRFNASHMDSFPPGFSPYTEYFVVESDGRSFGLSTMRGGPAVLLNPQAHGVHFLEILGPRNFLGYDPDVLYWRYYAEENFAEARKYDVPVFAYLSPSFAGIGEKFLDENFFRMQLELSFQHADSIIIYDPGFTAMMAPENVGWYRAISDFLSYLQNPTQFQITVDTSDLPADEGKMRGNVTPRIDRFTGIAFAAGTSRQSVTEQLRPGGGGFPTEPIIEEILAPGPYSAAAVSELIAPSSFWPAGRTNRMSNSGRTAFAEVNGQEREISVENTMVFDQGLAYFVANEYLEKGKLAGMWRTILAGNANTHSIDESSAPREPVIAARQSDDDGSVLPQPIPMYSFRIDPNVGDYVSKRGSGWRAKFSIRI